MGVEEEVGEGRREDGRREEGLRRIEEETEYEDESDCEEEMFIKSPDIFPVLAPPQEFQNCISPSAIYEMSTMSFTNFGAKNLSIEKCARSCAVASPAYSHDSSITSSSATEKSVRFSDRDHILSTPEPRPATLVRSSSCREGVEDCPKVKGILKSDKVPDVTSFMLDSEDGTLV